VEEPFAFKVFGPGLWFTNIHTHEGFAVVVSHDLKSYFCAHLSYYALSHIMFCRNYCRTNTWQAWRE